MSVQEFGAEDVQGTLLPSQVGNPVKYKSRGQREDDPDKELITNISFFQDNEARVSSMRDRTK